MKTTPEMRKRFVELYTSGWPLKRIAREFSVDRDTVRYWVRKAFSDEQMAGPLDQVPQFTRAGWALFKSPIRPPRGVIDPCSSCDWEQFCRAASRSAQIVLPCEALLSWEVYDVRGSE